MITNDYVLKFTNETTLNNLNGQKPVELHQIFSNEVLLNTKHAFEKMLELKIIKNNEFERTKALIEKLLSEKKNTKEQTIEAN